MKKLVIFSVIAMAICGIVAIFAHNRDEDFVE